MFIVPEFVTVPPLFVIVPSLFVRVPGALPNGADKEGTTPLMVVEDVEIAQALLAQGAQRGARNRAGQTALDIARQEGRGEIAQLLEGRAGAEAAGA